MFGSRNTGRINRHKEIDRADRRSARPAKHAPRCTPEPLEPRVLFALVAAAEAAAPDVGPFLVEVAQPSATLAVTATTPTNGARAVSRTGNITVTFSVPVLPSSLDATTFTLRDSTGAIVPAVITLDASGQVATLNPGATLAQTNNYFFARIQGGASGVADADGNYLAADHEWSFSTGTPAFAESYVFEQLVQPTGVEFSPDGRVYISEKSGLIKMFDSLTDTTPTIVADFRAETHNFWDRGMLGMALHPNFPATPYIYLLYSYDGDVGQNNAPKYGTATGTTDPGPDATGNGAIISGRLARITVGANGVMIPGSKLLLIHDWAQQYPSHSIGSLVFGPEGALYATAGDGASFNFVDTGQVGNPFNDPVNEGGALRSQDTLTPNDPTTLDGTLIRIDPDTGLGWGSNPLTGDANAQRIVATGLRNPFRATVRPGTREIWITDVGWNWYEEINRVVSPSDTLVENFGWPAYEGNLPQQGYAVANNALVQQMYNSPPPGLTTPFYAYAHEEKVVAGSAEPTGGSSATGLAFYETGEYPAAYEGALFFADQSRKFVYVMFKGPNGDPDPATRQVFKQNVSGTIELQVGPGGDLYGVDYDGGTIRRWQYAGGAVNRAPSASIAADKTSGAAPLTVNFDASGSLDPNENDTLTYAWDLDGDGEFDDSAAVNPAFTYTTAGNRVIGLRVTDNHGISDEDSVIIAAGNGAPVPVIAQPLTTLNWKVGDTITFGGSASDGQDGAIPAAGLKWELILLHDNLIDPGNSHQHHIQDFTGVASGSLIAPDHEYPSRLMLRLTATDSGGLVGTTSVILSPQVATLNFNTVPAGLVVGVGGEAHATPFVHDTIAGSNTSVSAQTTQVLGGNTYTFVGWSDGGTQQHNFLAPAGTTTYTADYSQQQYQAAYTAAPPAGWQAGQVRTFNVTIANTGTETWTAGGANPVKLGVYYNAPSDQVGAWAAEPQRVELPNDVAPGQAVTVPVTLQAPTAGGEYTLRLRLVKEGVTWFASMLKTQMSVGTLTAGYASTPPTQVQPGDPITYVVALTNTGTQVWTTGGTDDVHLGVYINGTGDGVGQWASEPLRFLLGGDVNPGETRNVTVTLPAPAAPGTYVLRERLVKENVAWFVQLHKSTIVVGGTAPGIVATSPAGGSANVAPTQAVTVQFSKPMDAATLTAANLTVTKQGAATPLAATVAYAAATNTATINLAAPLAADGAVYTLNVKGGAAGV
jgi:glucose/arabinose dehydrogenase